MTVIPAIDIIEGKCVRLTEGDYAQKKIYNESPLEVAKQFEDAGLSRLHLVDLDGAKAGKVRNWKVLEAIAGKTKLVVDFGGGIKVREDVQIVFNSGAALATVGSIAVKNEAELSSWFDEFTVDRFFLGADVKDRKIAVGGWLETTELSVFQFLENYLAKGVKNVFCTDVAKDGRLEGPSLELYSDLLEHFPSLQLTASGGVSSMKDLEKLQEAGCAAVIVGKAIYENRIRMAELTRFNMGAK